MGIIIWLKSEYILRYHLCHEMCQFSVLIILVYRSSESMFKPCFKFSWEKLKANTKYRDVLSNVGGSVWVLYSHDLKQPDSWGRSCQTPVKMLIPEEKLLWLFHFRLHLTSCWRHWAELSHSSSAASAPMQRRWGCPLRSRARALESLFQLVHYHCGQVEGNQSVERNLLCCDSSWAPQALTGCFLLMFYRRRCSLMRAWCCSSYGTRACWKLCGSGDLATVPNTHSRYSGKWIVLSGISALFRKHVLCVSPHKAHDHLGWTVKMHSSFERACITKSCI